MKRLFRGGSGGQKAHYLYALTIIIMLSINILNIFSLYILTSAQLLMKVNNI